MTRPQRGGRSSSILFLGSMALILRATPSRTYARTSTCSAAGGGGPLRGTEENTGKLETLSPNPPTLKPNKVMDTNSKKLTGKVALVTGASKGIGAGIAKKLAAEGAAVVVNYSSSKADGEKVAKEITAQGGKAIAMQANMSKQEEIERLFAKSKKAFGRVDILVNNAGIYEFLPLDKVTEEHFHKQFNLNVLGLLLASQAAAKQFDGAGGSIINISSVVSTLAVPESAVYSGTKGAVDAMTRALASELGPRGIRVNAIRPGMVETEGVRSSGIAQSEMRKQVEAQTPLGRIGQPQDIAGAAVFLASDESSWITGETFVISGGY